MVSYDSVGLRSLPDKVGWVIEQGLPYAVDKDLGERLAVANSLAITFTAFFLKHTNLFATEVAKDGGGNFHAGHGRNTYHHVAAIGSQKYAVNLQRSASFTFETMHEDFLVFLNFELLACYLYDRKHKFYRIGVQI
jgi:hypothetical protein